MALRRFLGLKGAPPDAAGAADAADIDPGAADPAGSTATSGSRAASETATVRRIVAELSAMPPEQSRFLAGFAYILSRAAHADLDISDEETRLMERFVVEHSGLGEAQAVLAVEIAKHQSRHHGGTEDYLVTREFGDHATEAQREALLQCCFAIGAADSSISAEENAEVRQIANELGIGRERLNEIAAEFKDQLSVIQAMRRGRAATDAGATGTTGTAGTEERPPA